MYELLVTNMICVVKTVCRGLMIIEVLSKDPTHVWFVSLSPLVPLGHSTPQHTAQDCSDGGKYVVPDTATGTVGIFLLIHKTPYSVNTTNSQDISQTYRVHQSDQHSPEYVRGLGTDELQNRSVKEKEKTVEKYQFGD